MTGRIAFPLFNILFALWFGVSAVAAEVGGVAFAPSPAASWRCGLTNDDFPGLAAEHMRQPLAAGCEKGDAKAYAVVVDLSDSRSAMRADQMAADAEEQLPSSWKIDSKSYDVVSLPGGRLASYSRLVGKGNGFTFLSGNTPMVAISANVPLVFEDESGAPRQVIAVFRVRSPLSASATPRKEMIAALDQMLREWAGTAQPASGRTISERDFELAAYARTKGQTSAAPPAAASAPGAGPNGNDRIAAALTAAVSGRATVQDLAALEDAAKRFPQIALGEMARSLLDDARRSSQQTEQQQILSAALESAKERASDVFSRFLIAATESGDSAAIAAALRVAKDRAWTLHNTNPAAIETVAAAILKRSPSFAPTDDDRAFFELPATELLVFAQRARKVPGIEEIARLDRDTWRLKNRRDAKAVYLVQHDKSIGILERQKESNVYRFQPITNLLELRAVEP